MLSRRGDVKFAQAVALLQRCAEYDLPTILGGDFNFTPESLLYELFTEGRVGCGTLAECTIAAKSCPTPPPLRRKSRSCAMRNHTVGDVQSCPKVGRQFTSQVTDVY